MTNPACSLRPPPNLEEDQIKNYDYFCNYVFECWKNRQYYKDEQNKLLYWIGSIFTAIAAASGILGAIRPSGTVYSFTFYHTLIFHVVFLICWFYFLYKQLNADMYDKIGKLCEEVIEKKFNIKPPGEIPSFFKIKEEYLNKDGRFVYGRNLVHFANIFIMILYIVVVSAPLWKIRFAGDAVTIDYISIISILIYMLILGVGQYIYSKSKTKIFRRIEKQWQGLLS